MILNQEKFGVENIHSVTASIAERVMQYLSGTKCYELVCEAKLKGLAVHSDASVSDCKKPTYIVWFWY